MTWNRMNGLGSRFRWASAVAAAAAVGIGAVACGTFGEDGGGSATGNDAAATSDAPASDDAAAPSDAAAPDGLSPDGGPRPLGPCSAGGFVVCADFEQGASLVQGGFTDTNLTGGGALTIASQGPGHVLALDTTPLASGISGKASVSYDGNATPDAVTFEARMRMPSKIGYAEILSLNTLAPVAVQIAIKLEANTQTLVLFEESATSSHDHVPVFARVLGAEWVTVRVALSFTSAPMTIEAWLDGMAWVPKTPLVVLSQRPTGLFFGTGLVHGRGPSPIGHVDFDDVKLAFRAP